MAFGDKVMHSRHSTATSGLNKQQQILLVNVNGIDFYGLYTRMDTEKKKSERFQKMTRLLGFCIFKMCAVKWELFRWKLLTALHMKKCSKVFRTWLTVTHCFIWKCNIDYKTGLMGWEHQHQPSDRGIHLGQLKTQGVSGYDITDIFQMSYGKKFNWN